MEATTTTRRRDPRNAADLEKIFPGRLWVIARSAAEHGWDVSVQPTVNGWALYLTEDHHCIHLFWKPNPRNDREQHPWTIVRPNLAARCPNGGRVHIRDIHDYLENHPDECLPTYTRRPIAELNNPECVGHMPALKRDETEPGPGWTPGEPFNPGTGVVPGYVAGECGHRVAQSEWDSGFRNCERC